MTHHSFCELTFILIKWTYLIFDLQVVCMAVSVAVEVGYKRWKGIMP